MLQRETWPLEWTTGSGPYKSLVTIFDLAELRAVVDTLRVGAGLSPTLWAGSADGDPTFVAGKTPIRAAHFNQLRGAIDDLCQAAELPALPPFSAGPIVAGTRVIKLSDTLDLRSWVEAYETARPHLASRAVRLFGAYTDLLFTYEQEEDDRLTEMWDASGLTRYFYDADGRIAREQRAIDSHVYWTHYQYDPAAIVYPDGRRIFWDMSALTKLPRIASAGQSVVPAPKMPTGRELVAEELASGGDGPVKVDGRGLPVLVGDPARPRLRLAYDGDGRLAKRVDTQSTTHFVGEHYQRTLHVGPPVTETVARFLVDGEGERWQLEDQDEAASARPIPDELWRKLRPLLESDRRAGQIATEPDDRDVLEALLEVLRRGGDWAKLPAELPLGPVRSRALEWRERGVLDLLLEATLGGDRGLAGVDLARFMGR